MPDVDPAFKGRKLSFAEAVRKQRERKENATVPPIPKVDRQPDGETVHSPNVPVMVSNPIPSHNPADVKSGPITLAFNSKVTAATPKKPGFKLGLKTKTKTPEKKKPTFTLRGTGITKRELDRTAAAQEKALDKAEQVLKQKQLLPEDAHDLVEHATRLDAAELEVKEQELGKNIILDQFQQAALDGLARQKYGCLIGAAGTGKTTVERQLAELLEATTETFDLNNARLPSQRSTIREMYAAICFCAFTGRAVQQMKRALPKKYHPLCATIHATLGYAPVDEEYFDKDKREWRVRRIFRPTFDAQNKLPYKICVIDESGMLGTSLWNELIAALPDECRIIMIGDINQLPPVHDRSVLGWAMLRWPVYTLEKIHRQAEGNPIIANAHKILRGQKPQPDKKKFALVKVDQSPSKAFDNMFHSQGCIIDQLYQKGLFDPFRDAIIVPTNVGVLGQEHINELLVMKFNPPKKIEGVVINPRTIITAGWRQCVFAVGDKVMLLQNDRTRGLTNGMTGVVKQITKNDSFISDKSDLAQIDKEATFDFDSEEELHDVLADINRKNEEAAAEGKEDDNESQRPASHIMTVRFGSGDMMQEVAFATAGQYRQVALAYAFTCHKSQGGEYETVVILAHNSQQRMLCREWLYTAVTRARERVILCHTDRALFGALKSQRIKGNTVREKAMKFLELESLEGVKLPYLPEKQEIEI